MTENGLKCGLHHKLMNDSVISLFFFLIHHNHEQMEEKR